MENINTIKNYERNLNNDKNNTIRNMTVDESIHKALNKMYNKEMKRLFLYESIELENTRLGYLSSLSMLSEFETLIDKNCYEFNITDIKNMFANQFTAYTTTLQTLFFVCRSYCDYWADRGANKEGTNVFRALSFTNDILPYININKMKRKYVTLSDIRYIMSHKGVENFQNYQDLGLILCLFFSIKGNQFIEIKYLREEDIDIENEQIKVVTEVDKNNKPINFRIVDVPKYIIDILLKADDEVSYSGKKTTPLQASDYIFKNVQHSSQKRLISYSSLRNRVRRALDATGYKDTGLNDLYVSGKLYLLNQITIQENREITNHDYQLINTIFGDSSENYNNLKTVYEMLYNTKQ